MTASIHILHRDKIIPLMVNRAVEQSKFIHQCIWQLEHKYRLSHKDACYLAIAGMTTILTCHADMYEPEEAVDEIIKKMNTV